MILDDFPRAILVSQHRCSDPVALDYTAIREGDPVAVSFMAKRHMTDRPHVHRRIGERELTYFAELRAEVVLHVLRERALGLAVLEHQ